MNWIWVFSSYLHRLIILMIDYYCCLFCFNCIDFSRIHFLYIGFLSCTRYFVLFSCANLIVSPSLYYRWAALFNSELFVMCKEDIRLFWVLYFDLICVIGLIILNINAFVCCFSRNRPWVIIIPLEPGFVAKSLQGSFFLRWLWRGRTIIIFQMYWWCVVLGL